MLTVSKGRHSVACLGLGGRHISPGTAATPQGGVLREEQERGRLRRREIPNSVEDEVSREGVEPSTRRLREAERQ